MATPGCPSDDTDVLSWFLGVSESEAGYDNCL
jgi:hypothetical protein